LFNKFIAAKNGAILWRNRIAPFYGAILWRVCIGHKLPPWGQGRVSLPNGLWCRLNISSKINYFEVFCEKAHNL